MSVLRGTPLALVLTTLVAAQQTTSFPSEDGGRVCADLYGQGTRAVLLAHGGRFNKESWREQARALAAPNLSAEKLKSRALFIVARDDADDSGRRLPGIRAQYDKAPQPKELIVLDGSAHAQFLFQSDQSTRVMREILRFLSKP